MKNLILGLAFGAAAIAAAPAALAQTSVAVTVGQPGFFGQINVGDFAGPPAVYAPRPVIIERGPAYIAEPVYLRVPPAHRAHWARYCGRYGACGRPVLFVQDRWYTNTYVPRYRDHFGPHGGPGPRFHGGPGPGYHGGPDHGRHDGWDRGHGDGRGHDRGDHHDRGDDHDRGGDHGHR